MINNSPHTKNSNLWTIQVHVKPLPISLNKSKNNEKLDKYCVNIKLRGGPSSQKSDLIPNDMTCIHKNEANTIS